MAVKAHFEKIKKELRNYILGCKASIKIAVAWITDEDLIRDLSLKAKDGKDVQLAISNSEENFKSTKGLKEYVRSGGKLFVSDKKFIHHKFCLIDESILITGSYNWTYYAENYNDEHIIVINEIDDNLRRQFLIRFNKICKDFSTETKSFTNVASIDARRLLSKIDEEEIRLRDEFQEEIDYGTKKAKQLGIPLNFDLIFNLINKHGHGVELVKWIIKDTKANNELKSGLKKLYEHKQLQLSFEYLVCKPNYSRLFTAEEIKHCKNIMSQLGITNFP